MQTDRLPIVVGVTGHRDLRFADAAALKACVTDVLQALKLRCPNSEVVLLTSLAEGADTLCAEIAQSLSIPICAALPMPLSDYAADFTPEGKAALDAFTRSAEQCFVVPQAEAAPANPDRDFAYRQASIYVATHCHALLALWDGDDGKKDGCGTAFAVHAVLDGNYAPVDGLPVRSAANTVVYHILTLRCESSAPVCVDVRGDTEAFHAILADTDDWNRRAAEIQQIPEPLLPEQTGDPITKRFDRLYGLADSLSLRFQKRYRRVLAALALLGTLLTVSFLLYDEASLHGLIFVTGAMLLLMVLCHRYALRAGCHKRYLENRVLAESLRTQAFLRYAGSGREVSALLPLIQQTETAWVLCALCALTIGEAPAKPHAIRLPWVEAQQLYHERAAKKSQKKLDGSDRFVRIALIGSVILYGAALVFELVFGGLKLTPGGPIASAELWRSVLKILLGTLSAGTLFIANYYGKQSLTRKSVDHRRMARFYAKLNLALSRQGQTDALLLRLAREELIENGNWYAYQSDNTPDLSI